jgi:hypothetical protein
MVIIIIELLKKKVFSLPSYTPLVIAIQQMLEYDNNNRIPDTKVRLKSFLFFKFIILSNSVT